MAKRPTTEVTFLGGEDREEHALSFLQNDGERWIAVCRAVPHCALPAWLEAVHQLILYPERTSSSILRADVMQHSEEVVSTHDVRFECVRRTVCRLLPKRPNLDASMEQQCDTYLATKPSEALVVMAPLGVSTPAAMPFYHPKVRSLAFHYDAHAQVTAYILPFAEDIQFDAAADPQHRLARTMLALITLQARIGWGKENGYTKRVVHDTLVQREEYQHLYMRMRAQYTTALIESWAESTDPGKHVFEDLGIAAFLILLWRDKDTHFVDVGCGNGLLVYLLTCEGYAGYGVDVQVRKSWSVYRQCDSRVDLRAEAIDAPALHGFPSGSFLIGNHADELSSWLPLMAHATPQCAGFVNIPCCRFALDGKTFDAQRYGLQRDDVVKLVGERLLDVTLEQIERGPPTDADSTSRNNAFLRYLSHIHLQAGWQLEKEALRIPSTKNWAFVGRRRLDAVPAVQLDERVRQMAAKAGVGWHARTSPTGAAKSH